MAKNPLSHRIGWCDYELSLKTNQKPKSFFALQYICGTEWFRKGTYNCERCFACSFKTLGIQLFFSNENFYGARSQPHKALVQEQRQLRDAWAPCRPLWREAGFPLTSSGEVGVGPFCPWEEGKGNPTISNPKFHLSPSLGKMVWNGLQLPSTVHTALWKRVKDKL